MRRTEVRIGDYTKRGDLSNEKRNSIISLVEKLAELKNYKMDTLFLAVSILDRYLAKVDQNERAKCLGSIAVSCLLIAAKLEEPISPNYNNMCRLLEKFQIVKIYKTQIIETETKVLLALDFSIRDVVSIDFLERYLRLYGMDYGSVDSP